MNRAVLRRFPSTAVALGFALVVMLAAIVWGVNVFRLPWVNIIGIEQSEIGAVVLAYLLVVPAFFIDRAAAARRRGHEIQGHAERQQAHAASVRLAAIVESSDALRHERDRAQQSLDSADVILLALDLGGQITLVNRKACDLLGWTEEELLGRPRIEYLPARIRDRMTQQLAAVVAGDVAIVENPILTKSGRQHVSHARLYP